MGNSRNENLLENMLGGQNELKPPVSNNEKILLNILGETGVEIDPLQSPIENLLLQLLEQGGSSVSVEELWVNGNGDYDAGEGKAYNPVHVSVNDPHLQGKYIDSNGSYRASDDNCDGYDFVEVAVPTATLGTKSITSNGTYSASSDSLDGYSSVTVNVPSSGTTLNEWESSGTIANPVSTVTKGNALNMAFADNKPLWLNFTFNNTPYKIPCIIANNGVGAFGVSEESGTMMVINATWSVSFSSTTPTFTLQSFNFFQINSDGTGFVDMSAYLPTSTAASITGYYW